MKWHGQLTNFQLRLVDRHSMAHGLEVEFHLEGYRRCQSLQCLCDCQKLALKRRHCVKRRFTNLPKEIVHRPKPSGRHLPLSLLRIDELNPERLNLLYNPVMLVNCWLVCQKSQLVTVCLWHNTFSMKVA